MASVNDISSSSSSTPACLDALFTTNFLGHFLLTNLLLDKCRRIVNLSSVMHHFPTYDTSDDDNAFLNVESMEFWKHQAVVEPGPDGEEEDAVVRKTYAPSKLAALFFSMELNRRYGTSKGIRSLAVNPGSVNSDIWRNYGSVQKALFRRLYLTSAQGASTSVAGAVMDFANNVQYLQPYWIPKSSSSNKPPYPLFEMLGPYVRFQPTTPRVPADGVAKASESLFSVCEELAGCQFPAR